MQVPGHSKGSPAHSLARLPVLLLPLLLSWNLFCSSLFAVAAPWHSCINPFLPLLNRAGSPTSAAWGSQELQQPLQQRPNFLLRTITRVRRFGGTEESAAIAFQVPGHSSAKGLRGGCGARARFLSSFPSSSTSQQTTTEHIKPPDDPAGLAGSTTPKEATEMLAWVQAPLFRHTGCC